MSNTKNLADLAAALDDGTSGQLLKSTGSGGVAFASGATFTDDVTFDGATAGRDIVFDRSDNALEFADNAQLRFGTDSDLKIFHNGSDNIISTTANNSNLQLRPHGTGAIEIYGDDPKLIFNDVTGGIQYDFSIRGNQGNFTIRDETNSEDILKYTGNGAAELYYNGDKKFETTSSGVTVTGTLAATAVTGDGSGLTNLPAGAASNEGTGNFIGGTNAGANLASGGEYNTLLGYDAGNDTTTGDYNVSVGYQALAKNQTGSDNVAIGRLAGEEFTFNESIFIGKFAGKERSSGNLNIGIGRYANAGYSSSLASGLENICIGRDSGATLTSGTYNVTIGSTTGFGINSGTHNTIVGHAAGYAVTSTYNTFLGAFAGNDITSGGKNVIIGGYQGNQDGLDIRTSSNRIVLSDGDGNIGMYIDGSQDAHFDGNVTAYSTTISDERLKTDIERIDNALDKVSQLNGYTFTYKKDGKASAGVIAQEVEKVLPSAVSEQEIPLQAEQGEEYKIVQYDQIHGLLIEAIKELKAEIEALKNASSK